MISSPLLAEATSAGSVFLLLYCGLGLAAFLTLAARVFAPGGARVPVEDFGAPEAGLAAGVIFFYGLQGAATFAVGQTALVMPAENILLRNLVIQSGAQMAMLLVVFTILRRRLAVGTVFGLRAVPWWRAALLGLGFVILLFPVVYLAAQLTVGEELRPEDLQQLVRVFQDSSWRVRWGIAITAVVVAPLVEEFIFRGLIYGVAKRFGGAAGAAVFSAAFFAFIHGSVAQLGPLFALGLCLVLAYEFTGSLLVPIALHAWFNSFELLVMVLSEAK